MFSNLPILSNKAQTTKLFGAYKLHKNQHKLNSVSLFNISAHKTFEREETLAFSLLTTSVFKAVNCIWKKSHTAQKTSSLLFMYFLVIPHTDRYWVRFPNIPEKCEQQYCEWHLLNTLKMHHKWPQGKKKNYQPLQ